MKHLFIVNDFPPIVGGQSTYLYNLCKAFPKDQLIVLAPCTKGDKAFDQKQNFMIIRKPYVFAVPYVEKILKILLPFFFSLKIIKQNNIGYIHCGHVLSTGVAGLILKKCFKKTYFAYTYAADLLEYQKYPLIKKLLQAVLHHADKIVTISRFNKDIVLKLGIPSEKIITIMGKIDYDWFNKPVETASFIEEYHLQNKKIVLSVNRLIERKGNDMMIKSFDKIKKVIPDAFYIIAGDGPYQNELKRLVADHHLNENVLFLNAMSDEQILQLYHLCDVFVMLPREIKEKGDAEGFGVVFLEANACSKPVIGGKSGGVADAIKNGETGILVDPLNTDEIAETVIRILSDQKYGRRLGENGRNRVKNEFQWHNSEKEIQTHFFNKL